MEVKKSRSMEVYGQSGYRYKETTTIMLKGQWLKELGFEVGDYISVSCEYGRLVITLDAERAELLEAEAMFVEQESLYQDTIRCVQWKSLVKRYWMSILTARQI